MIKKILIGLAAIAVVALVFVLLGGTKFLQIRTMMDAPQPVQGATVSAAEVATDTWEETYPAVGSVEAINGVTVATEVAGVVAEIAFTPGSEVRAGDLLVQLDASVEQAQVEGAQAELTLAERNLTRARDLIARNSIPQSELDAAEANLEATQAALAAQRAQLAKKRIVAPFDGRLGIRQVSVGEYLSPGASIVGLRSVSPIYVEFSLPQDLLPRLEPGYAVRVRSSAFPEQTVTGEITAIDSQINPATRNFTVQATFENTDGLLRPGMFVRTEVVWPDTREVLVIPQTAVIFNPYGDSIFLIQENDEGGLVAAQKFVRFGERRGDFVEVISGLEPGQRVVRAGAFKLRNGMPLTLSDAGVVEPELNPTPANQ